MLGQLPNLLPKESRSTAGRLLTDFVASLPATDSWLWLPARGFTGELPVMAAILAIACGMFGLVTVMLANHFIASAVAVSGGESTGARKRTRRTRAFRTETVSVMRRKELRLLARDPWLFTQLGQQMVYLAFSVLMIWRKQSGDAFGWMILVFVAAQLGSWLAWLTISGEDAPDLLAVAPVSPTSALRAKLEAALLPVILALLLPVALAWRVDLWLGVTLLVCGTLAATSGAMLQLSFPVPGRRREFAKRYKSRWAVGLLEFAIAATWTLAAFLMLRHTFWALLPPLIVVVPLAIRLHGRIERRAPVMLPAGALAGVELPRAPFG
jgi:ABC-2 type transport system permease protein